MSVTVFRPIFGIAMGLASLVGCRDVFSPQTKKEFAPNPATYAKDVAPILFERCASCHHPGGSAPFSVLDYEEPCTTDCGRDPESTHAAVASRPGLWPVRR